MTWYTGIDVAIDCNYTKNIQSDLGKKMSACVALKLTLAAKRRRTAIIWRYLFSSIRPSICPSPPVINGKGVQMLPVCVYMAASYMCFAGQLSMQ